MFYGEGRLLSRLVVDGGNNLKLVPFAGQCRIGAGGNFAFLFCRSRTRGRSVIVQLRHSSSPEDTGSKRFESSRRNELACRNDPINYSVYVLVPNLLASTKGNQDECARTRR